MASASVFDHHLESPRLADWPHVFERQVAATPSNTAIVFEGDRFTYQDLNRLANRIAHFLTDQSIGTEEPVGVCLDRSVHAIATMIGILKSGASFVPLDPEFPQERLAYMVSDAGIQHIICNEEYRDLLPDNVAKSTFADAPWPDECENPNVKISPDQLAYIMYTSGSTGRPKGVQIEHRALATYCFADIDEYELTPADRTLQFSTLNFDIAIEEIFPPLITGGCIVIRPRERANAQNELSHIVEENHVTAIHLATAYWHEWVDLMISAGSRVPNSIRLMVVTGEKVSADHFRRWQSLCDHPTDWFNAYGPTEATVTATTFRPPADWTGDNMPIGKPLKGYSAFILDEYMQPVNENQTGELHIGGQALARGYLNRPDLTRNSFVLWNSTDGELRLYKTGDLARWLPGGDIEFAGRIDHQIKLGSYRIEPGEIEAVLNQHAKVRESLISFDTIGGKKYLIAYIAHGDQPIAANDLANWLNRQLPAYMVPARYVFIDAFPKTINGKIDRDALPCSSTSQVAGGNEFIAPRSDLERRLCEIWSEVLQVPQVGIHDDFFALGGSSLLVTRVIAKLGSHLSCELPVRDFFANPTIASAARHIQQMRSETAKSTQTNIADDHSIKRIRESLPRITPLYFDSKSNHSDRPQQLFGVHYAPVGTPRNHAIIMCPSIGHEYARGHRPLQQLGIRLAREGCDVFRFDYAGTGNSSGRDDEFTTQDWIHNIQAAGDFAREFTNCTHLTVIGIRLGATLLSNTQLDADLRIYWDPVSNGTDFCGWLEMYHRDMLRSMTRFPIQRKARNEHEAFGVALPPAQKASLAALRLQEPPSDCKTVLISTLDHERNEQLESGGWPIHWQIAETSDAIFWHKAEYTESAFSSPETYDVVSLLVAEASK